MSLVFRRETHFVQTCKKIWPKNYRDEKTTTCNRSPPLLLRPQLPALFRLLLATSTNLEDLPRSIHFQRMRPTSTALCTLLSNPVAKRISIPPRLD